MADKRKWGNGIGIIEAAEILSVEPQVVIEMVRNDVLKPYSLRCLEPDYRFNRAYIQDQKGQFRNPSNLISKRAAGRILGKFNLHKRWLPMGHLKFVVSKDGKKRFLDKAEVENIALQMSALAPRTETAELLGVTADHVRLWTQQGLLRPVNDRFTRAFKITFYSKRALENLNVVTFQKGKTKRVLVRQKNAA